MVSSSISILVIAIALWPGVFSAKESTYQEPSFADCCTCRYSPVNVTLRVINVLKRPRFITSIRLNNTHHRYLLGIMQQASTISSDWRFAATYFNLELGFYLDMYHSVYANYSLDKSYWLILDGDMKPTPVGISNYVPENGERITFNLTRSAGEV